MGDASGLHQVNAVLSMMMMVLVMIAVMMLLVSTLCVTVSPLHIEHNNVRNSIKNLVLHVQSMLMSDAYMCN